MAGRAMEALEALLAQCDVAARLGESAGSLASNPFDAPSVVGAAAELHAATCAMQALSSLPSPTGVEQVHALAIATDALLHAMTAPLDRAIAGGADGEAERA